MLTLVRTDLGASRGQMGLALGAWAFMFIFTAPMAGVFVDRLGVGPAVGLGGLSIAVSMVARSAASNVWWLWGAVAIFGLGGPLISASAPTLVRLWFGTEAERRRAVAFYSVAPALGGLAILLVTNPILLPALGSWRSVLAVQGGVAVAASVGWAVTHAGVAGKASRVHVGSDGGHSSLGGRATIRRLLGLAGVRFALGVAFSVFLLNISLGAWLPATLEELAGLSPGTAANWVAVSVVVSIGATLVLPKVATEARRPLMLVAILLVCAAAAAVVALLGGVGAIIGAVVLGVRGALIPIAVLALMESPGITDADAGRANGLWFSVGEIGGVTGPLGFGVIADSGAGFPGALYALGVIAAATAVGILVWRRRAGVQRGGDKTSMSSPTLSV
jgi:cyanate permease